ncbi:MAG: 50S ribosomal protein L9 [Acidobacteriota bacterium]
MKVVLRKDIDKLGKRGDVVNVANGYARNHLMPKRLALRATDGNLKRVKLERHRLGVRLVREKSDAEELAKRLAGVSCTVARKVGEKDVLFGSVTNADIAGFLEKEGFGVDKRKIVLEEPIKALGIYNVSVRLHPEVTAEVKVWVVKE